MGANVVSGNRGALQQASRGRQAETYVPKATKGPVVVYRAKASKYVITIINPQAVFNPLTGRKDLTQPGKRIRFNNFIVEVPADDHEAIAVIEGLNEYGLGRDYWRLEDEKKVQAKEAAEGLLTQLRALPLAGLPNDLRVKLVQSLGGELKADFDPNEEQPAGDAK